MAAKHLKDSRKIKLKTLDEAAACFNDIAQKKIKALKAKAQAEAKLATIKKDLEIRLAEIAPDLSELEEQLGDFITANAHLFKKPRMHKTSFGGFGLRKATNLEIDDPETALSFVRSNGMDECFETTHKLVKAGIKNAIEAGKEVDGARVSSGFIVKYAVETTLIKEAQEAE